MTKEQARDILNKWIADNTYGDVGVLYPATLPVYDEVVYTEQTDNSVSEWTFKGLIKIAYDL